MHDPMNERSLKEDILAKIKRGEAAMRPRWHFVLSAALIAVGTALAALLALYLASFAIFTLRQTGVLFAPGFGLRGIEIFLLSSPWLIVLAAAIFAVILEVLVRHYAFAYRKPFLVSLAGIVVFVVLGSIVVSRAHIHEGLFRYAEEDRLPVAGRFYRGYGLSADRRVHMVTIAGTTTDGFTGTSRRGEALRIVVLPGTRLPFGMDFGIGDTIVVLGEREDDVIRAFGMREVEGILRMMPHESPRRVIPPPTF